MPTSALIATQLTDRSSRTNTLTIGTLGEVLGPTSTTTYRTPIESIVVTEEGPGGVSALDFDIVDPSKAVTLTEGANVEFWDVTNSRPLFAGFVMSWTVKPEAIGRRFEVRCVGVEAVLDWMVVPALTIAAGTRAHAAVQRIVGNAYGVGVQLRCLVDELSGFYGSQTFPTAALENVSAGTTTIEAVTLDGETVREALRKVLDNALLDNSFTESTENVRAVATVDFWRGLRVWLADDKPSDYANATVNESGSSSSVSVLEHEVDAGGVARQVNVQGGNAAGSGVIGGGSGIPGPIAALSDSSITTAAGKVGAGTAYLSRESSSVRGRLTIHEFAIPTTNVRAGSKVTVTSTPLGLSSATYVISQIRKTFSPGGRQAWAVTYGGLRPSVVRQFRRWTRTIRS